MVNKYLLALVACAALAGWSGSPALAVSITQGQTYHYDTAITTLSGGAPWTGTLELRVDPNGVVNGYYRADAGLGSLQMVTGGVDGNSIWFDIGMLGRMHVTATMADNVISGQAFNERGREPLVFKAILTKQ